MWALLVVSRVVFILDRQRNVVRNGRTLWQMGSELGWVFNNLVDLLVKLDLAASTSSVVEVKGFEAVVVSGRRRRSYHASLDLHDHNVWGQYLETGNGYWEGDCIRWNDSPVFISKGIIRKTNYLTRQRKAKPKLCYDQKWRKYFTSMRIKVLKL